MSTDSAPATATVASTDLSKPFESLSLSQSSSFDGWASPSARRSSTSSESTEDESKHLKMDDEQTAILDEFDPLVDKAKQVEQAWSEVESHPPPPTPLKEKEKELPDTESKPSPNATSATPEAPPPPVPKDKDKESPNTPLKQLSSVARRFTNTAQEQATALSNVPARLLTPTKRGTTPTPDGSPSSVPPARRPQLSQHDRQIPDAPVITQTPSSPPGNQASASGSTAGGSSNSAPSFDFQKFLDQMKARSAEPVAKYLRSFLSNFAKKPFAVNDQIKIIQDFLDFIALRMRECEPWRSSPDADFENATEAMEKLVMNRLYEFTFTPLVAKTSHPVTTDDLERDNILSQRIKLFRWIEEKHLDVPTGHEGFVNFACQELLKINHYKAPRDKLICILNSCKVIYGLIRHAHMDESADAFVPILIYVVLKTNPEHLISNLEYINRFRSPSKLQSETGYYLSSLMGAVSFVETMDFSSLSNITKEEFDKNVEEAVLHLNSSTPSPRANTPIPAPAPSTSTTAITPVTPSQLPAHSGEESARPLTLSTPQVNFDSMKPFVTPSTPNFKFPQPGVIAEDTKKFFQKTGDTIGNLKPFEALGKLFGDERGVGEGDNGLGAGERTPPQQQRQGQGGWIGLPGPFAPLSLRGDHPQIPPTDMQTPAQNQEGQMGIYAPYVSRRRSPSPSLGDISFDPSSTPTRAPAHPQPQPLHPQQPPTHSRTHSRHPSRTPTPHLDIPTLSTSIASIDAATTQRSTANMDTLMQIFPNADRELVEMVLEGCEGDVGVALERLLEMMGE